MVIKISSPVRNGSQEEIQNRAVMEVCVDSYHFSVDRERRVIYLSKADYERSDKLLVAALEFFPANCYVELDPFQSGSLFFCYKNSTQQVQGFILDKESDSPIDLQNLYTLESIKCDPSYQKIKAEYE